MRRGEVAQTYRDVRQANSTKYNPKFHLKIGFGCGIVRFRTTQYCAMYVFQTPSRLTAIDSTSIPFLPPLTADGGRFSLRRGRGGAGRAPEIEAVLLPGQVPVGLGRGGGGPVLPPQRRLGGGDQVVVIVPFGHGAPSSLCAGRLRQWSG